MDSSVALGAVLWCIGVLCIVIQVAWTRRDKRKWQQEVEAAELAGEEPPPPPEPSGWDRLPHQDRTF